MSEAVRLEDIDLEDKTFMSRLDFDGEIIRLLAENIKRLGLRNPIGLRPKGDKYQIIYGWERTSAVLSLGWDRIEAKVYTDLSELEAQLQNISDNIEHEDLTTLEIAYQVKRLRDKYGLSIKEVSQIYGGKIQYVYDLLTLTNMREEIKNAVHLGKIGLTHAIEINKFKDSKRLETLKTVIVEKLSISRIKELRKGTVKIKIDVIRKIVDKIVKVSQGVGITHLELSVDDLQGLVVESELNRLRKFLMTQIVHEADLKPGWTRERVVEKHLEVFRYLFEKEGISIPELSRRINNRIFNIILTRTRGMPNIKDYDLKVEQSREEFIKRLDNWDKHLITGLREDEPPLIEVVCWSFREDIHYKARFCNHEWVKDETEEPYCANCHIIQSADLSWIDPPNEEPPKPLKMEKVKA